MCKARRDALICPRLREHSRRASPRWAWSTILDTKGEAVVLAFARIVIARRLHLSHASDSVSDGSPAGFRINAHWSDPMREAKPEN
jgi:hypothetical protein